MNILKEDIWCLCLHGITHQAISSDVVLPAKTKILSVAKKYHPTCLSYYHLVAKIEETTKTLSKGTWLFETYDTPPLESE